MAIGSTFKESFQKALRGLEVRSDGFGSDALDLWGTSEQPTEAQIVAKLEKPGAERVWYLRYAFKSGMSVAKVHELTGIDPWFLDNLYEISRLQNSSAPQKGRDFPIGRLRESLAQRIWKCGPSGCGGEYGQHSNRLTRARRSSRPIRRITIRPMRMRTKCPLSRKAPGGL
jgi:hypothetical protein